MEDLPEPEDPTIATDSPNLMRKFNYLRTSTAALVGYEKVALINSTANRQSSFSFGFKVPHLTFVGSSMI